MPTPVAVLTIAGTDSAGGAGVHADLRAFLALGLHGASAIAALTAQSTVGIDAVHVVPTDFVVAQVRSVVGDLRIQAVKTGFLASASTVTAVGALASAGELPSLVVDPVLVRADGAPLFAAEVAAAYLVDLLPHALVATPNRAEAALLLGRSLLTIDDMAEAAVALAELGPSLVVVKGGDGGDEGDRAVDVVATADGVVEHLEMPHVATANDHGAGCSFAAVVAGRLAMGAEPPEAVRDAKAFVHAGLTSAAGWRLGSGHGPIDALARIDGFEWHVHGP